MDSDCEGFRGASRASSALWLGNFVYGEVSLLYTVIKFRVQLGIFPDLR